MTKLSEQVVKDIRRLEDELEEALLDKARIDWLEEHGEGCNLVSDDDGRWAVTGDGMSGPLADGEPTDMTIHSFVEAGEWSSSVRGAIDKIMADWSSNEGVLTLSPAMQSLLDECKKDSIQSGECMCCGECAWFIIPGAVDASSYDYDGFECPYCGFKTPWPTGNDEADKDKNKRAVAGGYDDHEDFCAHGMITDGCKTRAELET